MQSFAWLPFWIKHTWKLNTSWLSFWQKLQIILSDLYSYHFAMRADFHTWNAPPHPTPSCRLFVPFVQVNQLFLQSSPLATKSKGPGSPTDFERLRAERGRSEQAEDGAGRPEVFKPAVLRGFRPFSSWRQRPTNQVPRSRWAGELFARWTWFFVLWHNILHLVRQFTQLLPCAWSNCFVQAGKIELRW